MFVSLIIKGLLGVGVGDKLAKALAPIIGYVLMAAAVVGAVWWLRADAYSDGRADEKVAWEAEVQKIREERDAAMLIAAENDTAIQAEGEAALEAFEQAIKDATNEIPDQGLTERQRARVCVELQRQGRRCEFSSSASAEATGSPGE